MAAGTPDEKFKQLREENERRRKKKEEDEKRRKQEEEQKAKEALERRRLERLEQDERMRKPWQQPPAPKKPILRKGAKQKPVQPPSPGPDPVRQSMTEEKRREQRQGLQDFIRQQRQAAAAGAKTPSGAGPGPGAGGRQQQQQGGAAADGAPVVPLTWEELRMAAEAGFDELLRHQELQAAEEPQQSRATRHRSPFKSPFKGAPAPPLETVQVALVPTHNYNSLTGAGGAGASAAIPSPAARSPGPIAGGSAGGPATASASASHAGHQHPAAHGSANGVGTGGDPAAAAAAAAAAALRNSYKFSDAPGWVDLGHGVPGGRPAGQAGFGAPEGSDAPAAVLYPPASHVATGSAAAEGDALGRGSWADGFEGGPGDGHAGTGGSGSVSGSGGLRRGVTATTRYRAAPLDPSSLELPSADPWSGFGPGSHGVATATSPMAPGGGGGGGGSPRNSVQQQPRGPLPGPYDSPSPQQWPAPGGPTQGDPAPVAVAAAAPRGSQAVPGGGAGGGTGGAARKLALPQAADPLEASLLADGTLAALQQSDGFRLSSPRPTGQAQPLPPPAASSHSQPPFGPGAARGQGPEHQQGLQSGGFVGAPTQGHEEQTPQPQLPVARQEQRQARRGWGVPAQAAGSQASAGADFMDPPAPPWALGSAGSAGAQGAWAEAGAPGTSSSADPLIAEDGAAPEDSAVLAGGHSGYNLQARSPAAMRHSVGVGESGGPEMWQRESVPQLGLSQQHHPQLQASQQYPSQQQQVGLSAAVAIGADDRQDSDSPLVGSPPLPLPIPQTSPLTDAGSRASGTPGYGSVGGLGHGSVPQPGEDDGGCDGTPESGYRGGEVRHVGPHVDLSADLVRFSSPPGASRASSSATAGAVASPASDAGFARPAHPQLDVGQHEAASTSPTAAAVAAAAAGSSPLHQRERHRLSGVSYGSMAAAGDAALHAGVAEPPLVPAGGLAPPPPPLESEGQDGAGTDAVVTGHVGAKADGGSGAADSATGVRTSSSANGGARGAPALADSRGALSVDGSEAFAASPPSPTARAPAGPVPMPAQQSLQQSGPLLPPIAPQTASATTRSVSSSAKLLNSSGALAASGPPSVVASVAPYPLPPLTSGAESAASQPSQLHSVQQGTAQQQPPIRAPSPPASPPRRSSSQQRFHRQHSGPGILAGLAAAGTGAGAAPGPETAAGSPAVRPLSAEGQTGASSASGAVAGPRPLSAESQAAVCASARSSVAATAPAAKVAAAGAAGAAGPPGGTRQQVVPHPALLRQSGPQQHPQQQQQQQQHPHPEDHRAPQHPVAAQRHPQPAAMPVAGWGCEATAGEEWDPDGAAAAAATSPRVAGVVISTAASPSQTARQRASGCTSASASMTASSERPRLDTSLAASGSVRGSSQRLLHGGSRMGLPREDTAPVAAEEEQVAHAEVEGGDVDEELVLEDSRSGAVGLTALQPELRPAEEEQQWQGEGVAEEDSDRAAASALADEEEQAAATEGVRESESRGTLGSSLGRPPGTAEGSVLTGSHISARPWSGPSPSSTGLGSTRLGSPPYNASSSLLDDSVSSFDFRARPGAASRPASATASVSCTPASPPRPGDPASLLFPAASLPQPQPQPPAGAAGLSRGKPALPVAWSPAASGDGTSLRLSASGHARRQSDGSGRTSGSLLAAAAAAAATPGPGPERRHGPAAQGGMGGAGPQFRGSITGPSRGAVGRPAAPSAAVAATNAFEILQRPAGTAAVYDPDGGLGEDDDGYGNGQAFVEEPLADEPDPLPYVSSGGAAAAPAAPGVLAPTLVVGPSTLQHPPHLHPPASAALLAAAAVPQMAPPPAAEVAAMPAAPPAAAVETDLDALMREIQELSALRKALKTEFEIMGRGDAVAGLGTLSANFGALGAGAAGAGAAVADPASAREELESGVEAEPEPEPEEGPGNGYNGQSAPQAVTVGAAGDRAAPALSQAPVAPPAPAALLQWALPGHRDTQSRAAAVGPQAFPGALSPQPQPLVQPQAQEQQQQQPHSAALPQPLQWQTAAVTATAPPGAMQPPLQVLPDAVAGAQVTLGPAAPFPVMGGGGQALLGPGGVPNIMTGLGDPSSGVVVPSQGAPYDLSPAQYGAVAPLYGGAGVALAPGISSGGNAAAAHGVGDANGVSFAFAPMPAPAPVTIPAGVVPAAPPPPPPAAALQWSIPVSGGAAAATGAAAPGFQSPSRPVRVGGASSGSAASAGGGAGSTPRKGAVTPKRAAAAAGGGGSYAAATMAAAQDSPAGAHRGGGGTGYLGSPGATASGRGGFGGGGGGAAGAPPERPLMNEGSYAMAAVQARDRAERERAAREALQAEAAAAKAAAVQRSKSERVAAAAAGSGSGAPGSQHHGAPAAGAKETAGAAGTAAAPLGLKAPSSIGSYGRQPSPARPRPQPRAGAGATTAVAPPGGGDDDWDDGLSTPDSAPSTKPAWGTPSTAKASRIPTPPRSNAIPSREPPPPAKGTPSKAASTQPQPPAREDSLGSDFDFLERASDISDSETDSPEAYGVCSSPPAGRAGGGGTPPPPRREAFASPSTSAAAAASAAYRERLAEARPQPLRIPSSAAATPMGGASTASTVASRAVPTGGRGPAGGGHAGRNGHQHGGGGAGPGVSKPATPFTAAIRELMGLPGSAPLEQSRAAAGLQHHQAHHHNPDGRGPWPGRLTDEEDKLLASLKRLDADILRRGLTAAGFIADQPPTASGQQPQNGSAALRPAGKAAGKGASKAGGGGGKAGGGSDRLSNSLQQDQLRESLERLDLRLGALRRKMEDRACTLGLPSAAGYAGASTPSAASAAPTPSTAAANNGAARRDPTPTRGPPATLAKSRTPTPNKAKAIRDQRQQQISAVQGPTPPPARGPVAAGPPKPASAPVMGTMGGGTGGDMLSTQHHQQASAGGGAGNHAAAAAAAAAAGQPYGIPPRAPPAKAPASAPTGPAAVNAAQQQQQQQQQAAASGYGMMMPGTAFGGGGMMMPNGGVMSMYGMMPPPSQQPQQQQQQQQVAYVPTMLPNGQMAFVPQYVAPQGAAPGGGGGGGQGFPGFMMAGQQLQQPQQQQQAMMHGAFAGMMAVPPQQLQQQQGGGPLVAWGAPPQAQGQPQHGGGPSLYSFDRGAGSAGQSQGQGQGQGAQQPQYQFQQQQHFGQQQGFQSPATPSGLPYGGAPPPNGPLPHYHNSVMRSRSIGSRDGEAVAAMAAAAGLAPYPGGGGGGGHGPQHHHAPQGGFPQSPQQPQRHFDDGGQYGGTGYTTALGYQQGPQQAQQQQGSQPHPVQVQTFDGAGGGARGMGSTGGWGGMGGGPGGAGGASGGDAGVIKAVNLGLLLS